MNRLYILGAVATASLLASCGGGGNDSSNGLVQVLTGRLKETPTTVATLTAAQIDASTQTNGLQALTGKALCDVKVVALNYSTVGPANEDTNASGVLLVPGGNCTDAAPLLAYAKGTDVEKPRTLANPADSETFLLMAMYAAQGYAVVATDYLGYAKSSFPYHPYLHADSEARSVLDSLRAARAAMALSNDKLSGKVMFTGYSQGGHSSAAAQRAAERDNASEFNVVAGAHLAGPYNLSGSFKSTAVVLGDQFLTPFVVTSWQKVYGNVYAKPEDVFKAPYVTGIENLLPSPTLTFTTLVITGALPGANGETPAQARDKLLQAAFITDLQTNNNNALYVDALKNDLTGWNPVAKTLLCAGAGDPTVPPALHLNVYKAALDARGITTVSTVDVDAQIQATYGPGGKAPTDPASPAFATYYSSYHGEYEPSFCHFNARALFNTVR